MARTTVHHLTNGETNFTFRITGDAALVITLGANCWATPKREAMTVEAARKQFALAKRFGCAPGFTRTRGLRRLTTKAQLDAYLEQVADWSDDNWPEAELALQEEFAGQGYIEVAA